MHVVQKHELNWFNQMNSTKNHFLGRMTTASKLIIWKPYSNHFIWWKKTNMLTTKFTRINYKQKKTLHVKLYIWITNQLYEIQSATKFPYFIWWFFFGICFCSIWMNLFSQMFGATFHKRKHINSSLKRMFPSLRAIKSCENSTKK